MPKGRFNQVWLALLLISAAVNVALWRGAASIAESPGAREVADYAGFRDDSSVTARDESLPTSDADEKLEFLRSLEQTHFRRAREVADVYWSADGEYQSAYTSALADGLASIRDNLVSRYGTAIKDDPAFRWLYRPLDPLYRFLSSDQQFAVQKLRLERDRALQVAARDAGRSAGRNTVAGATGVPDAATLAIMQKYQAGLEALLDADTLLEFELRDSATAQQLRASGVDFSEDEFRQVHALVASLQGAPGDIDDVMDVRERLRSLLGDRRFASLWATRDPMFAEVAEIAERHTLPDAMALSVYEVLNGFQDRRMELARMTELDPDRALRDGRALADEERAAIARLVGDEVADEIVRGRALLSYRLFGASGRTRQNSVRQESQGGRFQ